MDDHIDDMVEQVNDMEEQDDDMVEQFDDMEEVDDMVDQVNDIVDHVDDIEELLVEAQDDDPEGAQDVDAEAAQGDHAEVEDVDAEAAQGVHAEVEDVDGNADPPLSDTIDLTDSPRPTSRPLDPLQCPVCLDLLRSLPEWKEVVTTPCGHLFCSTCLATALKSVWQCPTCRGRTEPGDAIKIFL